MHTIVVSRSHNENEIRRCLPPGANCKMFRNKGGAWSLRVPDRVYMGVRGKIDDIEAGLGVIDG